MADEMTPKEMVYLSIAIGEHLIDDEDKVYWAASAAAAGTLMHIPGMFTLNMVEECNRWNVQLFAQIVECGEVRLPEEYKVFIIELVRASYSEAGIALGRAQAKAIFG